jgi:hypothetical protein
MKKLLTLLFAAATISAFSQGTGWNPTPNNPYKWYTVLKDTTIQGFKVSQFDVSVWYYQEYYSCFQVDSLGRPTSPIHITDIALIAYANRNARICGSDFNALFKFSVTIPGIPFDYHDGEYWIATPVKEAIAERMGVTIDKIIE